MKTNFMSAVLALDCTFAEMWCAFINCVVCVCVCVCVCVKKQLSYQAAVNSLLTEKIRVHVRTRSNKVQGSGNHDNQTH